MSFFGGDHSKAHFVPSLRYRAHPTETRKEGEERRKAERAKLTEAGFGKLESKYFQFTVNDKAGKEKAEAACTRYAEAAHQATGIPISVAEGCFL